LLLNLKYVEFRTNLTASKNSFFWQGNVTLYQILLSMTVRVMSIGTLVKSDEKYKMLRNKYVKEIRNNKKET